MKDLRPWIDEDDREPFERLRDYWRRTHGGEDPPEDLGIDELREQIADVMDRGLVEFIEKAVEDGHVGKDYPIVTLTMVLMDALDIEEPGQRRFAVLSALTGLWAAIANVGERAGLILLVPDLDDPPPSDLAPSK